MIIIMNEKSWMKIRNKEKKQKSEKKSEMKLKKLTPLAAIILMTLILLVIVRKSEEPLSVETILKYTPENTGIQGAISLCPSGVLICFTVLIYQQRVRLCCGAESAFGLTVSKPFAKKYKFLLHNIHKSCIIMQAIFMIKSLLLIGCGI